MFSVRAWVWSGVACLVLWGGYAVAVDWIVWHAGRDISRDNPALYVLPQPLANHAAADMSDGLTVEQFGYSVRFPWSKVTARKDFKSIDTMTFDGGTTLMLNDPATEPNALDVYRGSGDEARLRTLMGDEAFRSRLDFFATELQASPNDLRLLNIPAKNTRATLLLGLKGLDVRQGTTAIYAVSSGSMRGFQIGDPRSSTPSFVRLFLFDQHDRQIEILVRGPKSGAGVTQEQVNAIVASVRTTA